MSGPSIDFTDLVLIFFGSMIGVIASVVVLL
jgi:hypothetical protein